jgi:hypothetical protein
VVFVFLISVNHEIAEKSPKTGARASARAPVFGYSFNTCGFTEFKLAVKKDYGY